MRIVHSPIKYTKNKSVIKNNCKKERWEAEGSILEVAQRGVTINKNAADENRKNENSVRNIIGLLIL
jgi:hypothetical protein